MGSFLLCVALAASTPLGASIVTDSSARRAAGASATVTVRIVHAPALIGSGFGPPAPHMQPRSAPIEAADRTMVDALIYDFE